MDGVSKLALWITMIVLYGSYGANVTNEDFGPLYANVTGDVMLGGLFPIHVKSQDGCGQLQDQDGIQLLEAFLYALDLVNNDTDFLPGFKLGAIAMDTCNSDTMALEHALEFIKRKVGMIQLEQMANSWVCSDGKPPHKNQLDISNIVGVVGAYSSEVSIEVASFLRLFKVPQVS